MKIAIIGYGFVGKALSKGFNKDVILKIIDPKLNTRINELTDFNPSVIFICVPTPMNDDGTQDISIVNKVIDEINEFKIQSLIVLKSTVLPNHILDISKSHQKFVYNPEFLREKHAIYDFVNSPLIVFGGEKVNTNQLEEVYKKFTKCVCKEYIHTDIVTSSFIKYSINSFLALKVTFFNELKDLYDISEGGDTWKNFISYLSIDKRIGSSHMNVPGHDGRKGFGGACLPKDSRAFETFSRQKKKPLKLLKKVIKINNTIRSKYNKTTEREVDQNINFNGDK
jgi:nucleotide sugar dehydrogenase